MPIIKISEEELLNELKDGKQYKEISKKYHLAENTVKVRVHLLCERHGCKNRVELVNKLYTYKVFLVQDTDEKVLSIFWKYEDAVNFLNSNNLIGTITEWPISGKLNS